MKIEIRPTRNLALMLAILLAVWLAAVNYANSIAYLVLALLAALTALAPLHAWRNLRRVRVTAQSVPPVFAGEQPSLSLVVENAGARPACGVRLEPPARNAGPEVNLPPLDARGSLMTEWRLNVQRRGLHRFSGIRVSTRFPMGLFEASFLQPLDLEYLVYPKPEGGRPLPEGETEREAALHTATRREGEDFHGLRFYVPGDPQRRIYWKAVARGRPLLVKEFAGGFASGLWLDWSATEGLPVEERLSQLAAWVVRASRADLTFGFRIPGVTCRPARGAQHAHQCLRALALHGGDNSGSQKAEVRSQNEH